MGASDVLDIFKTHSFLLKPLRVHCARSNKADRYLGRGLPGCPQERFFALQRSQKGARACGSGAHSRRARKLKDHPREFLHSGGVAWPTDALSRVCRFSARTTELYEKGEAPRQTADRGAANDSCRQSVAAPKPRTSDQIANDQIPTTEPC